ncbi:MAG: rhodanese-like domain-containing protein [Fidelibacterota bacterium]|nr:MAG: rhodanese-like domain-containing protein [Candidatus Neomarinimicrobiota bacterium]
MGTGCIRFQADISTGISEVPTISVDVLRERIRIDSTTFVLDVRTPEEYVGPAGHIENARLIPLQELDGRMDELSAVKDQHIYVICQGGVRSATATRMLLDAGFQASNIAGGMRAWEDLMNKQVEGN